MESMSFHLISDTHSLHHHNRTPSSAVIAAATPRPSFLKIAQPSNTSVALPLRISALPIHLPSEEGDDQLNVSALPSIPQVLSLSLLIDIRMYYYLCFDYLSLCACLDLFHLREK